MSHTIEDYNRMITNCNAIRIEADYTIRGGINQSMIESVQDWYKEHGYLPYNIISGKISKTVYPDGKIKYYEYTER